MPGCVLGGSTSVCGEVMGRETMSMSPAIGFLGFLKKTTNPSICTCEDTDPPSFRATLGLVVLERKARSRPHTQSSGSKAWIWKDKQPPEKMMTLQVNPIPTLVQPSILCHPQIPKPIPQGPLSLQSGPFPQSHSPPTSSHSSRVTLALQPMEQKNWNRSLWNKGRWGQLFSP